MSKTIKIEKLVLTIGESQVELTVAQAKELKSALDGLFEKEKEYIAQPYPVYTRPWWDKPYITWTSNGNQYDYKGQQFSLRTEI